MATGNIVNDIDIINLENDITSVRVFRKTLVDTTFEQEHLFDIWSPKLEQKLFFTSMNHNILFKLDDKNIIGILLVTLVYDQVIPISKKMNVLSKDMIKRIKDITKNLKLVIIVHTPSKILKYSKDCMDFILVFKKNLVEDISCEIRKINITCNFISELEDMSHEDLFEYKNFINYNVSESSRFFTKENVHSHLKGILLTKDFQIYCKKSNSFIFDKKSFEFSLLLKMNELIITPVFLNFNFEDFRMIWNSFEHSHSFIRFAVGFDIEVLKRRSKNGFHYKSWFKDLIIYELICGEDSISGIKRNIKKFDNRKPIKKEKFSSSRQSISYIRSSVWSSTGRNNTSSLLSIFSTSICSGVNWAWLKEVKIDYEEILSLLPFSGNALNTYSYKENKQELQWNNFLTGEAKHMPVKYLLSFANISFTMFGIVRVKSVTISITDVAIDVPQIFNIFQLEYNNNIENNGQCIVEDISKISAIQNCESILPWIRYFQSSITNVSASNSLPDIALIVPEFVVDQTNDATMNFLRPSSVPVMIRNSVSSVDMPATSPTTTTAVITIATTNNNIRHEHRGSASNCQTRQMIQSNLNSTESTSFYINTTGSESISSVISLTPSTPVIPQHQITNSISVRRLHDRQAEGSNVNEIGEDDDEDENCLGRWPHVLSPALACLGCTLGLFNISRFSILSIQFGANFIVQFLILSLIIGIPLLTLQVCLGQRLAAGTVDMWKISPLFQGVGIALLTTQAFVGIYSIIGISWMFVYFRDSFITKQDKYKWAEPFGLYRKNIKPISYSGSSSNNTSSISFKLYETVPDYFSGTVLQRHHLNEIDAGIVTFKFQMVFNLAVVWMIIFVSLSKGLRSYGKVIYVFTLVPIFGTLVLCTKLLELTPPGTIHQLFSATVWTEFFINGRSWITASSEVFLTWGLFGAAAMQIAAHNKHKHLLQRDTSLVVILTFVILLLAAFLANTCVQILKYHGYVYTTSSFEKISDYTFMRPHNQRPLINYSSTPERFMAHASFLVGQRTTRPGSEVTFESGYQALRLSTELVPATFAILGTEQISPFWAILFYFILILFGIAQQLAIWHCVITGIMAINIRIMKLWETTITFFSCACAYILGLPMTTELGIYVVYYLDYTVGGSWWIMVLYLVQVGAVFAVRGRPHTGETVVAELFSPRGRYLKHWAGPLLSFTWNVILPITLMVFSIAIFKSTGYRELYTFRKTAKDYWAVWARQVGALIQLIPILIIPVVAIIQTCRYLNTGPPDIFDRIQLLYRPSIDIDEQHTTQMRISSTSAIDLRSSGLVPNTMELSFEDPPPKYTPPPSYTTATGARIAKMLRQSFRHSIRRIANILGENGNTVIARYIPVLQQQQQPLFPDCATLPLEMEQRISSHDIAIYISEAQSNAVPPNLMDRQLERVMTIDRTTSPLQSIPTTLSHRTLDQNLYSNVGATSILTAAEIENILRSSIRGDNMCNHERGINLSIADEP